MKPLDISVEIPSTKFGRHISVLDNYRILFSGPFGIGKTTFINNFFSGNSQYFPIMLRPVNYSVARNEDIFSLIKYDILYQLLEKDKIEVEDFGEFSNSEILSHFLTSLDLETFTSFIACIPEIDGSVSKGILGLDKLKNKFKKFKKEVNSNQDIKKIDAFLKTHETQHFLLENDFITQMIRGSIGRLNNDLRKNNGGVVLVIDDLDRIDPEHIFRLFNVFSTHFNCETEAKNKFDFHRIIFVCDIKNIRNIFRTKYGLRTDFNGYIDKFYSTKVFTYDNKSSITEYLRLVLHNQTNKKHFTTRDTDLLLEILAGMLDYGVTNLRNIQKTFNIHDIDKLNEILDHGAFRESNFGKCYFTRIGLLLVYIMGDSTALIDLLEECVEITKDSIRKTGFDTENTTDNLHTYFLPIVGYKVHNWNLINFSHTFENLSITTRYTLKKDNGHYFVVVPLNDPSHIPPAHIWNVLLRTLKILKEHRII